MEKEVYTSPSQDVEVESESGYILGSLCLYISISLVAASFVGSGEEIYWFQIVSIERRIAALG